MGDRRRRGCNGAYEGEHLARVAFPLGGMGAGMVCLEGVGALSHVSVRGRPELLNEPLVFSALCVRGRDGAGHVARVLEGPVPAWKIDFPWPPPFHGSGRGQGGKSYGLPRCVRATFEARFPFARVALEDPKLPVAVELTGWSPFVPGNADDSSLPVAALEYTFTNRTDRPVEAVYSFHAANFMRDPSFDRLPADQRPGHGVRRTDRGFILEQHDLADRPWTRGSFLAATDAENAAVNCRWFRGGWFDALTIVWQSIADGQVLDTQSYEHGGPSPGGSLYVPFTLGPGERRTIRLRLAWYVPETDLRSGRGQDDETATGSCGPGCGCDCAPAPKATYRPWYAGRFDSIEAVDAAWRRDSERLKAESRAFSDCFYDSTLPPEVIEAVAANLTILKSPTVLRQTDGRLWLWEGCNDASGCCPGSCAHVWNYAQALPHLFPELERGLRETEFGENQDERGRQAFRACLPIRPTADRKQHAAADGQLGGIIKVLREWRISGDGAWLRSIWPQVRKSLDYCISAWDPDEEGWLKEPHHNTYDIEFWGPDGMCGSFYAAALKAACVMGEALGQDVERYQRLYGRARARLEGELFDGEYFIQKIRWTDLRAPDPVAASAGAWNVDYSEEARALLQREGPKYQYGTGCLSDGVLGAWLAETAGLTGVLDPAKVRSHLSAVHRYNFRRNLAEHANPQRPAYALGDEAGLLLCSWPKGGQPTLPFVYSNEVWTGIEYQVASHLMMMGAVEEGLAIVRAVRDRYDGRVRNPFDEYECGHWYGRAMASYGLLQGLTGQWYDAVTRTLYLRPRIAGDWRAFLCTATGYGTIGMKNGQPFLEVRHGTIAVDRIELESGQSAVGSGQ